MSRRRGQWNSGGNKGGFVIKWFLASPWVGWSAVLSGAVAIVGNVFLLLFYIFQAPRMYAAGGNAPDYLGRVNDAAIGIQTILLIPIALALLEALKLHGPVSLWQRYVVGAALIGMLIIGCIQLLYAFHLISFEIQTRFVLPAYGIIGLWMILIHNQLRVQHILSPSLAWLGIVVGASYLLLFLSFFAFGGYASAASNDPSAFFSNLPFIIATILSLLIGFFAYPVWAIWLGRVILSGKMIK